MVKKQPAHFAGSRVSELLFCAQVCGACVSVVWARDERDRQEGMSEQRGRTNQTAQDSQDSLDLFPVVRGATLQCRRPAGELNM